VTAAARDSVRCRTYAGSGKRRLSQSSRTPNVTCPSRRKKATGGSRISGSPRLIAEEVAKVYPELVFRDQKGRIQGVRYDELAPMLLNEVQKQKKMIAAEDQRAAAQDAKIVSLEQQLVAMRATVVKLQPEDELAAQR
jgi:hypothetical protein